MSKTVLDEAGSALLQAAQRLQKEINPAWKEWVETVGISEEPFTEGWQERMADPTNKEKESYIAGLRQAQTLLFRMIAEIQEERGTPLV